MDEIGDEELLAAANELFLVYDEAEAATGHAS
jgi:hypothetical protein